MEGKRSAILELAIEIVDIQYRKWLQDSEERRTGMEQTARRGTSWLLGALESRESWSAPC